MQSMIDKRASAKMLFCPRCENYFTVAENHEHMGVPVRVLVQHRPYGCDTGCCGHNVVIEFETGFESRGEFDFMHDFIALREQAQTLADELGVPFDVNASEFIED